MNKDYKIEYVQAYTPRMDITIIMKYIYCNNKIIQQEVSGFYYGEPSLSDMQTFLNKNYIKGEE